jgi:excisionase family DNA binding protein
LSVAEAAQALGTSEKAVRRRIERKVLPSLLVDGKRRIPASAIGASSVTEDPHPDDPPGLVRRTVTTGATPGVVPIELLDRLERLARENGQLRQIEQYAGQTQEQLLEARARIRELEAQLADAGGPRRRRWFGRGRPTA